MVIHALTEWHQYLTGTSHPVTILTDHKNLTYFKTPQCLSHRQARWQMFLQDYDLVWNHTPGAAMGLLWISCPHTTYPTFSSLPTTHRISPSTTSSLPQTDNGTNPHSSPTPHSPKRNSVPNLDMSSCFTFLVSDPFRSSTGPSVRWSPFHIPYVFLFRIRSCSASATQHWLSVPFHLSSSYDSLLLFLIGSAMW